MIYFFLSKPFYEQNMTHLVGVAHSFESKGILEPFMQPTNPLFPSQDFLDWLKKFPKGTKVGIEQLGKEDFEKRKRNFSELGKVISNRYGSKYAPHYPCEHGRYWTSLEIDCKRHDLEVVYLEDLETWMKYNKAMIDYWSLYAEIQEDLTPLDETDNLRRLRRFLKFNEKLHKLSIKARKIHEIDRDEKLLEATVSSGLEISIVGHSHSDFWFGNKEDLGKKYGIVFDSYSTDLAHFYGFVPEMIFTENAGTSPDMVFEREILERSLRLISSGRIVESGTPDYVGTWDYETPSKGYFEVFIHNRDGDKVSGLIQDCLGVADFSGEITKERLDFVKTYGDLSCKKAAKNAVRFQAVKEGNEFYGRFHVGDRWGLVFCMVQSPKVTPFNLGVKLNKKIHENLGIFDQLKLERDIGD